MKTGRRWIASSDVLSIFPTLIWKFELASEARHTLNAKLLAALDELRPTPGARAQGQGWQSHHALHTLDELAELVAYIDEAAMAAGRNGSASASTSCSRGSPSTSASPCGRGDSTIARGRIR
jgi:hypothetical protein